MGLPITLSEIAPRISAGAFILNSGLGKRGADAEAAAGMHGFASGTYPFLKNIDPQQFAKALATAEIAVGATLLAPFVPTAVAGLVLTGFSGGLLGLYLNTPGMRKPGSLAPTEQGLSVARASLSQTWTRRHTTGELDAWAAEDPGFAESIGWEAGEAPFGDEFSQVWSLGLAGERVYAGTKPAALLASNDGGATDTVAGAVLSLLARLP